MSTELTIVAADAITPLDLAGVAARTQREPTRHIAYFGNETNLIAEEIGAVPHWEQYTAIARRGEELVGWMIGDCDVEIGRIWWWGPVVAPLEDWNEVADDLYQVAREILPSHLVEEELAGNGRHQLLAAFAERHGFREQEASVALQWSPSRSDADPRVRPFATGDSEAMARLHDLTFPGTHANGRQLATSERHPIRLIADDASGLAGYIAVEIEPDGKAYIDYLGIDERARGQGYGRALLHTVLARLYDDGAPGAHLTVRESNAAARALYTGAGFEEAMLLRPFRKGFLLDS